MIRFRNHHPDGIPHTSAVIFSTEYPRRVAKVQRLTAAWPSDLRFNRNSGTAQLRTPCAERVRSDAQGVVAGAFRPVRRDLAGPAGSRGVKDE